MSMHNEQKVAENIGYIQNLFLKVGYYLPVNSNLDDIISFLDKEPNTYRSLSYESAAYEIAYKDLKAELPLNTYKEFYLRKGHLHPFHMQIGLGWAFAKAEISPNIYPLSLPLHTEQMVYDGLGYYHALFKERKTILGQFIPSDISDEKLKGYNQGIGRRLWYICRGDMKTLINKIESFDKNRQADLWRGIGIACGYVGGSDKSTLEQLVFAAGNSIVSLRTGIALAAYSRVTPDAVIPSIELACEIVCGIPINKVVKLIPDSEKGIKNNWINELEKEFA